MEQSERKSEHAFPTSVCGNVLSADELSSFADPQGIGLGVGGDGVKGNEFVGGDLNGDDSGDGENIGGRNTEELREKKLAPVPEGARNYSRK